VRTAPPVERGDLAAALDKLMKKAERLSAELADLSHKRNARQDAIEAELRTVKAAIESTRANLQSPRIKR
jgi:predicted  nucleic acid-binding Zn-ribbon protein